MIGPADEGRTRHVDYTVHQAYLQLKSLIKSAAQDNRGQVVQAGVLASADAVFDAGVAHRLHAPEPGCSAVTPV